MQFWDRLAQIGEEMAFCFLSFTHDRPAELLTPFCGQRYRRWQGRGWRTRPEHKVGRAHQSNGIGNTTIETLHEENPSEGAANLLVVVRNNVIHPTQKLQPKNRQIQPYFSANKNRAVHRKAKLAYEPPHPLTLTKPHPQGKISHTGAHIQADAPGRRPTLTTKQQVAIACLLVGGSVSEAAAQARVSRQTASGWLNHDRLFQAELQRQRRANNRAVQDELQAAAMEAVEALQAVLRDPQTKTTDRVKAATAILDRCGHGPAGV